MVRTQIYLTQAEQNALCGLPQALSYLESRSEPLLLSSITGAELFTGVRKME